MSDDVDASKSSSLFPAYSRENDVSDVRAIEGPQLNWLENASFSSAQLHKTANIRNPPQSTNSENREPAEKKENVSLKVDSDSSTSSRESSPVVRFRSKKERENDKNPSQVDDRSLHVSSEEEEIRQERKRSLSSDSSDSQDARWKRKKKHKKEKKKKQKKKDDSDRERSHKRDKKKDRRHRSRSRSPKRRKEKERKEPVLPNRIFIEDLPGNIEQRYRLDHKKDINNWAYKSIYAQNIASYKRASNRCIGTINGKSAFVDEKKAAREMLIDARYFSKVNRRLCKIQGLPLQPTDSTQDVKERDSQYFIPLRYTEEADSTPAAVVNPLGVYDTSTQLWLQGKGMQPKEQGEEEEDLRFVHDAMQMKTADFNARLKENPSDIQLWMNFLRFQDELAEAGNPINDLDPSQSDRDKMRTSRRALMEIKAAILDKAIEKNPSCVKLRLEQLRISEDILDPEEVRRKWKDFVFKYTNNPVVWRNYLSYVQGRVSAFTVSGAIKVFSKCLTNLRDIHQGSLKSHPALPCTRLYMLELILDLCQLLLEAGHQEKGLSMLQALLELAFSTPGVLQGTPLASALEILEVFWDSGTGRVGEEGAKGWSTWVESKGDIVGKGNAMVPDKATDEQVESSFIEGATDLSSTWVSMEKSRCRRHFVPWRPADDETEEDCEDPERLVMFDDISSVITMAPELEFEKFLVFTGLLRYMGVHVPSIWPACNVLYLRDVSRGLNMLHTVVLSPTKSKIIEDLSAKEEETTWERKHDFVENLFQQILPSLTPGLHTHFLLIYVNFVIEKCMKVMNDKNCDKKEKKVASKAAKKSIKSILSEEKNRDNLALWGKYAKLEQLLGNLDESRRVLDTAIGMRDQSEAVILYCQRVELEIGVLEIEHTTSVNHTTNNRDRLDMALHVLVCLALEQKYTPFDSRSKRSPTVILKARKALQDKVESLLASVLADEESKGLEDLIRITNEGSPLLLWLQCLVYFQYVTVDLQAACQIFHKYKDQLKPNECRISDDISEVGSVYHPRENVCWKQYQILVEKHVALLVSSGHKGACELRRFLLEVLDDFPHHQNFLQLLVSLDQRGSVFGSLRRYFTRNQESHSSISWLYAVIAELWRADRLVDVTQQAQGNTVQVKQLGIHHQVRAMLERAVNQPAGRRSLLLWRIYFLFEQSLGGEAAARGVYYRAVQICPWAKALHMDLICSYPSQLQATVDIMTEKEIRLRTPLEELELLMSSTGPVDNEDIEDDVKEIPLPPPL